MTEWRKLTQEEKEKYKNNKPKDPSHAVLGCIMYGWRAIFFIGTIGIIYSVYEAVLQKNYFQLSVLIGIPILYGFCWKIPELVFRRMRSDQNDMDGDKVFIKEVIVVGVRSESVRKHVGDSSVSNFKDVYYATIIHMENGQQIQSEVSTGYYVYSNFVKGMEAYVLYFLSNEFMPMYVVDRNFYGANKPLG